MTIDLDELRQRNATMWERGAKGWGRRQDSLRKWTAPVSHWLVEAIAPQPGQELLELAAGPGETGFLAAELLHPGGRLVSTDLSEGMLEVARARAAELGLDNVEFKQMDAEWIDAEVASFDAVLCRWGYMLMPDPQAAMRETRRVLRPAGRLALAVWDRPDLNLWATAIPMQLVARGLMPAPEPGAPGMFRFADRDALTALIADAGFHDIEIDAIELEQHHESLDAFWAVQMDMAAPVAAVLEQLEPVQLDEVKAAVAEVFEPFTGADRALDLKGVTVVASATA